MIMYENDLINMYYTGVGSRDTPDEVCTIFKWLAEYLSKQGYTLRSGRALGADLSFEEGCDNAEGYKQIFLPWPKYNLKEIGYPTFRPYAITSVAEEAFRIAREIHPKWSALKSGGRAMHARNVHQVMGPNLVTASRFLICWTQGGHAVGGTRTAIKLAEQYGIPIYNAGGKQGVEGLPEFLDDFDLRFKLFP
jgi:hypothetical protein